MEKKELTIEEVSIGDTVKRINGNWRGSFTGKISKITKLTKRGIMLDCDDPLSEISHSVGNFILINKNNNYEIF